MTTSPLPVEGAVSVVAADRARSGWTLQGWEPEANREEGSRRGGAAVKGYPAIPGDLLPPEPRTQTLDSESSQGLLPARSSGPRLTGKHARHCRGGGASRRNQASKRKHGVETAPRPPAGPKGPAHPAESVSPHEGQSARRSQNLSHVYYLQFFTKQEQQQANPTPTSTTELSPVHRSHLGTAQDSP